MHEKLRQALWGVIPVLGIALIVVPALVHVRQTARTIDDQREVFEQRIYVGEAAGTLARAYSSFVLGESEGDATQLLFASDQVTSADGHLRDGVEHNARFRIIEDVSGVVGIIETLARVHPEILAIAETIDQGGTVDPGAGSRVRRDLLAAYQECRELGVEFDVRSQEVSDRIETDLSHSSLLITLTVAVTGLLAIGLGVTVRNQRRTQFRLRAAQVEAEQASRAKSDFLANMSHEIRTPMTAILGFSDRLLDADQHPREREECVETIRRNGDYLLRIINDILDLSKIEAGKIELESVRCDIPELVRSAEKLLRNRATEKGLSLEITSDGKLPQVVLTDPVRVRQVLINLIGNAIKFTEQGTVRLTVRLAGSVEAPELEFDVSDTGIGMTEEQRERLFAAFSQADTSTTRKFGGTGLGLVISRQFSRMLGGDLFVLTSAPGVGTTMRARIAVEVPEGTARVGIESTRPTATPRKKSTDDAPLAGLRLLLAEDGPDNQKLISFVLRKAGAEVEIVDDGEKAVAAILGARDAPFDALLLDMQMPVMDGYTAARVLREEHGHEGPIIALTAHAMAGDRQRCIDAGCSDYATKPIVKRALIETILAARMQSTAAST